MLHDLGACPRLHFSEMSPQDGEIEDARRVSALELLPTPEQLDLEKSLLVSMEESSERCQNLEDSNPSDQKSTETLWHFQFRPPKVNF